jgi:L-2-hydroxyglutarate oxidase LhgO
MLYQYCEERSVQQRRVGKLVVATDVEQIASLERIATLARENDCRIDLITGREAGVLEPELRCSAALFSPHTGSVDSHGLMEALLSDFESEGGVFARCSAVEMIRSSKGGWVLEVDDEERTNIKSRYLINSAGMDAPLVAGLISDYPREYLPQRCFAKGSYFSLTGNSPFSHLIYPVPVSGGLGVHLTVDLQGQARFGPDVEWIEDLNYNVGLEKRRHFYEAIRRYWPNCTEERLIPGYAGIRPKLGTPQAFAEDFVIQSEETHSMTGLVNLFGIESPGLTACLAIAEEVVARLGLDESKEEK